MVESKIKTLAVGGGWLVSPPRTHAAQAAHTNRRSESAQDGAVARDEPVVADQPPELDHLPTPGNLIDGKYRIEHVIARGGAGIVYAATHCVSGKKVALKWLAPGAGPLPCARERFFREASATARIAHPNIVDIYDVCADQGSAYLVMEYLRGETLAERLARGPVAATQAIAWLMPALRAVHAAHTHGVIHRDLKPENIFMCCTKTGEALEPKVLDFGISKITNDEERDLGLTWNGAILGTPYYMSPEQIRGARTVDERADVYALGVILFEVLSGKKPFDADTYNELIVKIMTESPPSLAGLAPQLDPALVAIVEKAMAHDAAARIDSVESLALALEPFAGGASFRKSHASQSVDVDRAITLSAIVDISGVGGVGELSGLSELSANETAPEVVWDRRRSRLRSWLPLAVVCLLLVGFELITHLSSPPSEVLTAPAARAPAAQLPSAGASEQQTSQPPVQLTSEVSPPTALGTETETAEDSSGQPSTSPASTSDNGTAAADNSPRRSGHRTTAQRRSKRAAAAQNRARHARATRAPELPGLGLRLDSRDFR